MSQRIGLIAISILNLIGSALGVMLSIHYYDLRAGKGSFHSFCNVSETVNCDVVTMSRYAELFPGVPLSSAVVGWMVATAIIALLAFASEDFKKTSVKWVLGLSGFGLAYSLFNLYVMSFVLKTYCMLCLGVEAVTLLSFLVALALKISASKDAPGKLIETGDTKKTFATVIGVCLFLSIVLLKGADSSELSRSDENDMVQGTLSGGTLEMGDLSKSPIIGSPQAPITIVEFSDFECPFCARGASILSQVESLHRGKVKIVYRGFPLDAACNPEMKQSLHIAACAAAKAVLCAEKEGKFEAAYETLFAKQSELRPGAVETLVQQATGIDAERLKTCMESKEIGDHVLQDINDAKRLLVRSTPTFFINGRRVEGAYPPQVWSRIIDSLMQNAPVSR